MRRTIKGLVYIYRLLFTSSIASCRFSPTCSQYLLGSIEKYGIFVGVTKSFHRLLSCQPFSKRPYYDPA